MKTAAVICEYNPFHNGHAYQLRKMRELAEADFIVAVMSGNYVQRGEPAVFDKYARAEMALNCGADLVLELPAVFSSSSAAEFARAGVMTCLKSGLVDTLCFGTEGGITAAELEACLQLRDPEAADTALLKEGLRSGLTWPEAMSRALREQAPAEAGSFSPDAEAAKLPNNILALEYLRAIRDLCDETHPLETLAIARTGAGYHDEKADENGFSSASAIRSLMKQADEKNEDPLKLIEPYVPEAALPVYRRCFSEKLSVSADDLSLLLSARLLELCRKTDTASAIAGCLDVSREIADRLKNRADHIMGFEERIRDTKTRQYTYTRISRALLHICLGIRTEDMEHRKENGYISYLNVLGFRRDAATAGLLKELKARAELPVITKTADNAELLLDDLYYDQIYYALKNRKGAYERSPVVV